MKLHKAAEHQKTLNNYSHTKHILTLYQTEIHLYKKQHTHIVNYNHTKLNYHSQHN